MRAYGEKMTQIKNSSAKGRTPSPILPSYRIQASGRGGKMRLTVFGVIGLSELDGDRIKLFTRREFITVCGFSLEISVFEGGVLEIEGAISQLDFSSAARRWRRDKGI